MKSFYKKIGFIIGFLVLVFCIQTFVDEKTSEKAVLLVLFTMVILNADKFSKFVKGKFTVKKDEEIKTEKETIIYDDFQSGGTGRA